MRSRSVTSVGRYGIYAVLSLVLTTLTSVVIPPQYAYATGPLSAPDGSGAYQVCNTNEYHDAANDNVPGGSGAHWRVWIYCNWGGTKGTASPYSRIQLPFLCTFNGGTGCSTTIFPAGGDTSNACAGTTWTTDETAQTFKGCLAWNSNGNNSDYICVGLCHTRSRSDQTINRQYWLGGGCSCWQPTGLGEQGRLMTSGTVDAYPSQPADWYTGGAAPPVPDSTAPVPVCSRTLTDTNAMTGQFRSGALPTTVAATATQGVWNYGDTNTTTVTGAYPYDRNHTYGALSTMPTDGWTATLTVTYTANSGHTFADGSTTKTAVCSLRVDFLNPDKTTAGGTGGSSGSGSGDINNPTSVDDCSPSGWGWLNPVSLIKGVFCLGKLMLIPSSATQTSMSGMWTSITTKAPFSVLYEVVTFIPNNLDDFAYSIGQYSPVVSHGVGGTATSPICSTDNGSTRFNGHGTGICNYSGEYPFQYVGSPFRVDGGTGHVTDSGVYLVRQIALFAFGLLFFYSCYRGIAEILK